MGSSLTSDQHPESVGGSRGNPALKRRHDILPPSKLSQILSSTTQDTPECKWVGLKKLTYRDPRGTARQWECAFRTTRRSECDGVAVVAFVRYPETLKEDEIVLISQFRPPVGAEVVEAPAGLVDEGEDAASAALRELLEETGYTGVITSVSPIVPSDPGMTDANMRMVTLDVNGDAEENKSPKARPDDGEFITVRRLPASRLKQGLDDLSCLGYQVDARLYAMALGYSQGLEHGRGRPLPARMPSGVHRRQLCMTLCITAAASLGCSYLLAKCWHNGRCRVR